MAGTIKGITIEIGGDTVGLQKALSDVNSKSRDLQSELKQVERALKFNPGNAELLAQKQQLLAEQVQTTTEKLNRLKDAQSQVEAQFQRGDIGADQYRAFQRQIIQTESQLSELQQSLANVDNHSSVDNVTQDMNNLENASTEAGKSVKDLSEKLNETGEKVKGAGESLSKNLTAPITALGAGAMLAANNFDSSAGKIQAQLGITADEAQNLGKIAQDVWKDNFGESIADVSEGIVKVKQNIGDLDGEDLKNVTKSAYTLADAFGADINDTTKTAGTLIKNFDMDAQHAMDLITVGFQKGGDYSGELLDTLNEYAPQFSDMGMQAEDFLGILISGAQNGAFNLDKVGDAVKEFNLRAQNGSKTTAQGFSAIGLNASKMAEAISQGGEKGKAAFEATIAGLAAMKDPVKQNIAGVNLFGTQWEDLRSTVITSMADGIGSIKNVQGATKEASDALQNNFGAKLQKTLRELGTALQPLGEVLLSMAENILPTLSSAAGSVAQWFSSMGPIAQTVTVILGMLAAAIGPVLMVIGSLANGIGVVVKWFAPLLEAITEAGGLLPLLGEAFAVITGPIGLVVAAVAGLIAIFVALYKNNEDFRNNVLAIWDSIKAGFQKALTFISENIVKPIMTEVVSFTKGILGKFKSFWDENGQSIMKIVNTVFSFVSDFIQTQMRIIQGIFEVVWPIISGVVQVAWALIKTQIKNSIDIILGIIQFFTKVFTGDWKGAFDTIKETAQKIMNNVVSTFKGIDLVKIGKNIIQGLIDGIGSMAGAVWKKVQDIADSIKNTITDALQIHSPSRVMRDEVGKWIPLGVAEGISANLSSVRNASLQMSQAAIPQAVNNNNSVNTSYGSINVTISAKDVQEFNNVVDFFNRLPQVTRQY